VFGKKLAVNIIIVVAVAISGVALAAGTVRTDGMEPEWQKALVTRSEALNRKYNLGSSEQRRAADATPEWAQALAIHSEALNRKYNLGSSEQRRAADATPEWAQALAIHSEALNRKYNLAKHAGK
jgi:hypothetical protein